MIARQDAQKITDLKIRIQRQMLDLYMGAFGVLPVLSSLDEKDYETTPNDVVYREDSLKLLHYRPTAKRLHRTPLVIVYALVNRHYILDIENRSVVRNLLDQGFDIYMIDWGTPGSKERTLTIDNYVNGYMDSTRWFGSSLGPGS